MSHTSVPAGTANFTRSDPGTANYPRNDSLPVGFGSLILRRLRGIYARALVALDLLSVYTVLRRGL